MTLAPGQRTTVTLSLTAGATRTDPASAHVWFVEQTPYAVPPVSVTLKTPASG